MWCEHENPVEECEPCAKGYTRFFPVFWSEAHVQVYIEAEGALSLESQAVELRKVLEFTRPEDALLSILAAAQPHLGPGILPEKCLAYVCFDGPKSSGKTVATEAVTEIAGGRMIRGGTLPAMIRLLTGEGDDGPPKALGIDEVDSMQARLPDLQGILRTGNRWNADYPISVPKGKGWETRLMNVGGFKVFNYSGEPDDATQTRCLMIRMHPVEDPPRAAHLAVESLFNNPILTAIRNRLARKAEFARKRWDSARMENHMRTPEFKARVARLDSVLPRGKQLGAVLLAVADAMGWSDEAERVIASYIAERREDSLEPEREVLAEIVWDHLSEMHDGFVELQNADVLAWANQRLKDRGLTPISKFRWPSIRDGFKIESGRRSKGILLKFGWLALKALDIESPMVTPEPERSSAETGPAPGFFPAGIESNPEYLRHAPGNEMHPKMTGAANIKRLHDEIAWRVRNRPDVPTVFVRKEVGLALQLPEDSETNALVDGFIDSVRKGMDP